MARFCTVSYIADQYHAKERYSLKPTLWPTRKFITEQLKKLQLRDFEMAIQRQRIPIFSPENPRLFATYVLKHWQLTENLFQLFRKLWWILKVWINEDLPRGNYHDLHSWVSEGSLIMSYRRLNIQHYSFESISDKNPSLELMPTT